VGHQQRRGGAELDGEVAVADGVERVEADLVEAELRSDELAVDRVAGAGQRRRAQRQAVDALAAVFEPFGVAPAHLVIGHQVVAESHRLGDLEVGEAGHRRAGVGFGDVQQLRLEFRDQRQDLVDRVAQPQADVGRDLVVAAASGVEALAGVADERGEALLDVEVDVLVVEVPGEFAAFDFAGDLRHPALDVGQILCADDALLRQHLGVGERTTDVLPRHALVEGHRRGVALDQVGNGFGEAARPGLGGGVGGGIGAGARRRGVCHDGCRKMNRPACRRRLRAKT